MLSKDNYSALSINNATSRLNYELKANNPNKVTCRTAIATLDRGPKFYTDELRKLNNWNVPDFPRTLISFALLISRANKCTDKNIQFIGNNWWKIFLRNRKIFFNIIADSSYYYSFCCQGTLCTLVTVIANRTLHNTEQHFMTDCHSSKRNCFLWEKKGVTRHFLFEVVALFNFWRRLYVVGTSTVNFKKKVHKWLSRKIVFVPIIPGVPTSFRQEFSKKKNAICYE